MLVTTHVRRASSCSSPRRHGQTIVANGRSRPVRDGGAAPRPADGTRTGEDGPGGENDDVYFILGFFINSSSGLAVLSIPIIAPLADAVGLPKDVIITAYLFGLGMISFITPTGLVLATLDLVDVTYDKWLKFAVPLMAILTVFCIILLLVQTGMSSI